jgi:hypothetical protein
MFWDNWIPAKYLVKAEICAIEICFIDSGINYLYAHCRNKKNKFDLGETGTIKDLSQLPKNILRNKTPLVLIVNGKGVFLKKITINKEGNQDFSQIVHENLPAINQVEFFIQLYKQNEGAAFIVLCRKEQVNKIIEELQSKKFDIAGILLGAPAVIGLQPLWSSYNFLSTSLHQAELSNGSLDTITAYPPNFQSGKTTLEGMSFSSEHTLGIAGGISYFTQSTISESANEELISLQKNHTENNKLRFLAICCVALAFILSVTNVIFYTVCFDKNNTLETELGVYQGKQEEINKLLSDYQKNKGLIENAGILNKNKLTEYADRIGKTLPKEVVLSELYFNPKKDNDYSEDSLMTFKNKEIVLRGNCKKSFIINEWISVLKMQKFIHDVNLEKFAYNSEGLLPNFEIKLITE